MRVMSTGAVVAADAATLQNPSFEKMREAILDVERECSRYRAIADLEAEFKRLQTAVAETTNKLASLQDEVTRLEERKRGLGAGFVNFLKATAGE